MARGFTAEESRRGGLARARAFTSNYQAATARRLSPEQRRRAGRAGARAVLARYGPDKLRELARAWNLAHPSSDERTVLYALADLGMVEGRDYEREYEIYLPGGEYRRVDVAVPHRRIAIEILGGIHDAPGLADRFVWYDRERRERLERGGWKVLELRGSAIADARAVLATFLGIDL